MDQAQQPPSLSIMLINPRLPLLMQSIDVFKDKRPEPVVVAATVEEATTRAQTGLPCVLIFSIVEDEDVIACIQMCKTLSLERRDGIHRLIVVSVKDNKKLQDSVLNRGASEFVNSKTAPSGLVFKTTRLLAQIQRHLDKLDNQSKVVMSSQPRGPAGGPGMVIVKGPAFNVTDEVIAEDTWVVNATPPKKLGSRWAVETEGPDPDSGTWEPLGENSHGEEQWAWHSFDENGKSYSRENKLNFWIFVGQRPSFDLESEKWKLISAQPELFYQSGKTKGSSKFKLEEEKGLVFTQDTPQAAERIAKSKVIGAKVRQDRMQQAVNKTNNHTAASASAQGKSGFEMPAAEVTPDYDSVNSIGVLRANKKEVALDRVPCEEFGHPEGNWEPVKQQGWAFVTPEMRARGLAGLPKLAPFWMLDKKQNGTKPYFDSDSNSWLFEKTQMPRKVDKFDELPPVYQDFLNTTAQAQVHIDKAKASAEIILKQENERTSQKFESIRDVKGDPSRPHKTPLNYFFKMSLLANSSLDSTEIVAHIAANVSTIVPIESITLLNPSPDGHKSKAVVSHSTSDRLNKGRVLELQKLPFKEAMTQLTPQVYNISPDLCANSYPIISADGTSVLSCVLLFYTRPNKEIVASQGNFIEKVLKQLSRIYQTAA